MRCKLCDSPSEGDMCEKCKQSRLPYGLPHNLPWQIKWLVPTETGWAELREEGE